MNIIFSGPKKSSIYRRLIELTGVKVVAVVERPTKAPLPKADVLVILCALPIGTLKVIVKCYGDTFPIVGLYEGNIKTTKKAMSAGVDEVCQIQDIHQRVGIAKERFAQRQKKNTHRVEELKDLHDQIRTLEEAAESFSGLQFFLDKQGRIIRYHSSSSEDLYIQPKRFLGKTFKQVLPKEASGPLHQAQKEALKTKGTSLVEYDLNIAGEKKTFKARVRWLGESGYCCSVQNITAQRTAEMAFADERNLLRTLMDNLPDFIYLKDTQGRFILANQALLIMMGLRSQEEIVGHTDVDFFPAHYARQYKKNEMQILRTGKSMIAVEERVITAGKHEMWVSTTKVALKNDKGVVLGLIGVSRNITHHKVSEDKLVEEKNLLRTIMDTIPDPIYIKDTEGRFILTNKAVSKDPQALIGKTDFDLTPHEKAVRFRAEEQKIYETGNPIINDLHAGSVDGIERYILVTKIPIRDSNKKMIGLVGINRDVTALRIAEEGERQEHNLLKTLMNNLPDEIYLKDKQGKFLLLNNRIKERIGAVEGKTDFDMLPREMAEEYAKDERRLLEGEARIIDFVAQDIVAGNTRHYRVNKFLVRTPEGEPFAILGINWDVTKDRKTEEQIKRQNQLLLTLINAIPDAVYLKDRESRFILANKKLSSQPEILVGKRDLDFLENQEEAKIYYKAEQRLMAGEISALDFEQTIDSGNDRRYFHVTKVPIQDDKGEVIGLVGINREVTQIKKAQEVLSRDYDLLRKIMDHIPDSIYLKDRQGRFIIANKACLHGHGHSDVSEIVGKTDFDYMPKEPAEEYALEEKEVIESGVPVLNRERHIKTADRESWLIYSKLPVLGHDKIPVGVIGINRDITEQRRVDEAMLQTQKLESLGILAGGVAHDFNNILTIILGRAELGSQFAEQEIVKDCFKKILSASERAAELCKQMLAYSGKGRFVVQHYNINQLVEEMTVLLSVSLNPKIKLHTAYDEDLPKVEIDATQIRQVIMNLVVNASEAMAEKSGYIQVRTGVMNVNKEYLAEPYLDPELKPGRYVFMEVHDQGTGMSAETKARIFEPFFTTKFVGRGLGLAAVLGIIRGHQGALKIFSQVGVGTTFQMLLPIAP
ncbi:MAG: PAS domain-containing protein [Verrucomicrobiota bacterium]|nr:PAS domain-containing protein [Verrucomicrobiota bacterium]